MQHWVHLFYDNPKETGRQQHCDKATLKFIVLLYKQGNDKSVRSQPCIKL